MPGGSILPVEGLLNLGGDVLLNGELVHGLLGAIHSSLLHTFRHIGILDDGFAGTAHECLVGGIVTHALDKACFIFSHDGLAVAWPQRLYYAHLDSVGVRLDLCAAHCPSFFHFLHWYISPWPSQNHAIMRHKHRL